MLFWLARAVKGRKDGGVREQNLCIHKNELALKEAEGLRKREDGKLG